MPQLPLKTFTNLVEVQKAALQASNPDFTDLSPGSPLLSLIEANAGVGLFMQYLVYKALLNTRMVTSSGLDLDSFGAQFLFGRYPSIKATGMVLFTRFVANSQTKLPVNTLLRTGDGTLTFQVIPDTNNTLFQQSQNAYVIPVGTTQFAALVQCTVGGAIGNIQPNTLTKFASTVVGISTLTNPAAFINGVDQESDASFRTRFQSYINSRSRGTLLAIQDAILNTQPGITYTIQENVLADGTRAVYVDDSTDPPTIHQRPDAAGNLLIYYDDGTGSPPSELTTQLQSNVDAVRAAGISFSLAPAIPIVVSIFMATQFAPGFNKQQLIGNLAIAVETWINQTPVGQNLIFTKLYQVIYENAPGLVEASNLLINGRAADLVVAPNQVARFIPAFRAGGPGSTMTID